MASGSESSDTKNEALVALENRSARDDGRLFSPSAERNRHVIFEALAPRLAGPQAVVEIGSGTGEHGAYFCERLPRTVWYPSDPDPRARTSIAAWSASAPNSNLKAPLNVLTTDPRWPDTFRTHLDGPATMVVSMNMIHISPWASCEGLFAGASSLLDDGGLVFLYGPFLEGEDTSPSNLAFDESLRTRNPEWGVRALGDVVACAEASRFRLEARIEMPANNRTLFFVKRN